MEAQIPDGTVEELDKEAVEEPRVSNPPFCHLCPFLLPPLPISKKGQGPCGRQVSTLTVPASLSAGVLQGPSTQGLAAPSFTLWALQPSFWSHNLSSELRAEAGASERGHGFSCPARQRKFSEESEC